LVANLRIIPENMERNLHGSYDIYFSQRVLLALVDAGLERQKGYEMVQKLAMHCWKNKVSFPQTVRNDPAIKELLSTEVMDRVFDPSYYLRKEDMIFSRVFDAPTL
jgi:adenylosuccinate lyase